MNSILKIINLNLRYTSPKIFGYHDLLDSKDRKISIEDRSDSSNYYESSLDMNYGIINFNVSYPNEMEVVIQHHIVGTIYVPGVYLLDLAKLQITQLYKLVEYNISILESFSNKEKYGLTRESIYQYINKSYSDKVVIYDTIQSGSIKSKIILYGTLTYMGIANYGSFRAGLSQISKDLQLLERSVMDIIIDDNYKVRSSNKTLDFTEKLLGDIMKIDNMKVVNIDNSSEFERCKVEIIDLLSIVSREEKELIVSELRELEIPLKNSDPRRSRDVYKLYAMLPEEKNTKYTNIR